MGVARAPGQPRGESVPARPAKTPNRSTQMNPSPDLGNRPASPDEWIEPAPGDRRKIIRAAALMLLGLLLFHVLAVKPTQAWVNTLPACERLAWLRGMLVGLMALMPIGGGAILVPVALRVLRHGRVPPPGTWLWKRTRVWRGRRARWMAGAMLAWVVLASPAPFFAWHVVSPLHDQRCGPNPVPPPAR